jgi:CDP-diacylglycerol--glycerol-3-phosphate 3-phosphatidyltransferase
MMGAMIVADVADGVVARQIGNARALRSQRRLDSVADLALYAAAPLCTVWGRPGLLKREVGWVVLLVSAQTASLTACLLKFRKLPRYHTELVRWSSGAMGVALAVRIACDRLVWPSRAVVGIAALAHFEAMAVTLLLDVYHDPIPTAWCVGARRRDVADGRR